MKKLVFLCFFLCGVLVHAQKETLETIDAEGINSLVLSADEIYKITITTAPVNNISFKTHSDGEYSNRISLDTEIQGERLLITSRFPEILRSGYDKLSAHKVFAMEVNLEIPEGLAVDIKSNLASVYASGHYQSLLIQLNTGSCYLKNLAADTTVNTYNGSISVEVEDAHVTAVSRHGEVVLPQENSGTHKMVLSSINGDIRVDNTK